VYNAFGAACEFPEEAPVVGVIEAAVAMDLDEESIGAMQADPEAAKKGLEAGFAASIGVDETAADTDVALTGTEPDIGLVVTSGRRLGDGKDARRLSETLTCHFEVISKAEVAEELMSVLEDKQDDPAFLEAVADSVQTSLEDTGVVIETPKVRVEAEAVVKVLSPPAVEPSDLVFDGNGCPKWSSYMATCTRSCETPTGSDRRTICNEWAANKYNNPCFSSTLSSSDMYTSFGEVCGFPSRDVPNQLLQTEENGCYITGRSQFAKDRFCGAQELSGFYKWTTVMVEGFQAFELESSDYKLKMYATDEPGFWVISENWNTDWEDALIKFYLEDCRGGKCRDVRRPLQCWDNGWKNDFELWCRSGSVLDMQLHSSWEVLRELPQEDSPVAMPSYEDIEGVSSYTASALAVAAAVLAQ
jgi:hypothetical protein